MTKQKHPTLGITLAAAFLLSASVTLAAQPAAAPAKASKGDDCGALATPADKKEYSDTMKSFKKDATLMKQGQNVAAAFEKRYQATCGQLVKYYPQFKSSGAPIAAAIKNDYRKISDTLSNTNSQAKNICDYAKGEPVASKAFMDNMVSGSDAQNNSAANASLIAKYGVTDAKNKQAMGKEVLKAVKSGDGAEFAKEPKTSGDYKGHAIVLLGDVNNMQTVIKSGTAFIRKQMNTSGAKRGSALTAEDQSVLHFKTEQELQAADRNVEACAALTKHLKDINDAGQAVAKDLVNARNNHSMLVTEWGNTEHIMANAALKDGTIDGKIKSIYNEKMEKLRGRQPSSNPNNAPAITP